MRLALFVEGDMQGHFQTVFMDGGDFALCRYKESFALLLLHLQLRYAAGQAGRLGNSVSEVNMHRGILTKIKKFHTLHSRPNENQGELRSKSGDAKWIHPLLQCV